jgi:hypothetical protein
VAPSVIIEWGPAWSRTSTKPRDRKLTEILDMHSYESDHLLVRASDGAQEFHAYSDTVCGAVLEYYAFEGREQARHAFRRLAQRTLRDLIYSSVGYDPRGIVPPVWKHFHARMLLNDVPRGWFSIFREMSDVMISAAQNGLALDSHTIPDGSAGIMWAKHWKEIKGDDVFGERKRFQHVFPDDFPQSVADVQAWIYPNAALGEYRDWMQEIYLPQHFPKYIASKVKTGALAAPRAALLLAAINPSEDDAD